VQALELSTADRDGHVIVTVKGEINVLTQRRLDIYLGDVCETGSRVVVDLSGLTFLDASGLGVLLRFWKELNRDGGSLTLAGARYRSARILWTTGLDKRLALTTDIDQAIALTERPAAG
jgi:anti-sigma B factor antagonist